MWEQLNTWACWWEKGCGLHTWRWRLQDTWRWTSRYLKGHSFEQLTLAALLWAAYWTRWPFKAPDMPTNLSHSMVSTTLGWPWMWMTGLNNEPLWCCNHFLFYGIHVQRWTAITMHLKVGCISGADKVILIYFLAKHFQESSKRKFYLLCYFCITLYWFQWIYC